MTQLDLDKRQFRILYRQFLFRMVDVELLSSAAQGDISKLLGRFAAIVVFLGLWLGVGVILTAGAARGGGAGLLLIWAEEHFLIATTLLAVGLFAVIGWDSIFPDRREVMVVGPLPVRARTFLLAKAAAVAGALGLAVGVLNALTGLAVPLFFSAAPRIRSLFDAIALMTGAPPSEPGSWILSALRLFFAYWITVLSAGAFTFCLVVSVQGLAQLLPRQSFLRVSAALQIIAFFAFVGMYFTQLPFASTAELLTPEKQKLLQWLPSYWFFAMLQQLNGSAIFTSGPEQVALYARRAWIGLSASLAGALASYLLCYFRTLRMIAEQPDILPSRAGLHWLPKAGGAMETAIVHFSVRTLARSRKHRVTLSFYLGLAFAIVILGSKDPALQARAAGEGLQYSNLIVLISSVLVMCAAIAGVRIAFSMPMDLRANWVFRIMPMHGGADHLRAARRSLYALSLAPVWLATAAVLARTWPWKPAAVHLAVLGLFGGIVVELLLLNFRKIPFTCSYLPGKSNMIVILVAFVMLGFSALIDALNFEMRALMHHDRSLWRMLAALAGAACALRLCAWWRTRAEVGAIEFEDVPEPAVMALGLNRDGSAVRG